MFSFVVDFFHVCGRFGVHVLKDIGIPSLAVGLMTQTPVVDTESSLRNSYRVNEKHVGNVMSTKHGKNGPVGYTAVFGLSMLVADLM